MKDLKMRKITYKNEREHNKYFKVTRITLFIITLPITLPFMILCQLGEWSETLLCLVTDLMTKAINNLFKLTHWEECRELDQWELEELEEERKAKKIKIERKVGKYEVD